MKRAGYILLQIAGYLILLGGISDVAMTFFMDSLPAQHLKYLAIKNDGVSQELKNLDFAFLRAIGGCLIGIGAGALTIIYGALRKKIKWALTGLLGMVTIGEGINALQLLMLNSPYFIFPLICVILTWIGGLLWWFGNKNELK